MKMPTLNKMMVWNDCQKQVKRNPKLSRSEHFRLAKEMYNERIAKQMELRAKLEKETTGMVKPVEVVAFFKETEKAVYLGTSSHAHESMSGTKFAKTTYYNNAIWLPKSQIQIKGNKVVAMPAWLAKQHDIACA